MGRSTSVAGLPCRSQQSRGLQSQHSLSTCGSWARGCPSPVSHPRVSRLRGGVMAYLEAFRLVSPEDMPFSGGHGAATVSQQVNHTPWAAHGLGTLGQTGQDHTGKHLRDLMRCGAAAASPAAGDSSAPGCHARQLGQPTFYGPKNWPAQPPAHTPRLSRPSGPAHLLSSAQQTPHAHIHSLQHCGAAAIGAVSSARAGPGPASGPQASAGHPMGPNQALAIPGTQLVSTRCQHWAPHLVGAWSDGTVDFRSWGFSSLPAHEYVVQDSASRLRSAAPHPGRPAGRCQPHHAHHLGVSVRR